MPRDDRPSALHTLLTTLAALFGVAALTGRFGRGGEGGPGPSTAVPPVPGQAVSTAPSGWSRPQPEVLARPTYWPVVLALGLTFIMWGLVSSLIVTLAGLLVFVVALGGWIGELRHE